jgi:hypothetical protein
MSENTSQEPNGQDGPVTLREALLESFQEHSDDAAPEPDSTESEPTDSDSQLDASDEQEAEDESSEEHSQDESAVIQAPEHWSAEDRATFDELPSAAQDYLLKREKQYETGIQSKSEQLKPIDEALSPYDQTLKLRGIDRATAIKTWVQAQTLLDTDPVNGLKMLIQSYGTEVGEKLAAELGFANEPDYGNDDPEVAKLKNEIKTLKQASQQTETQYQSLRNTDAMEQVRQFKEETDGDGKLLRPHFDDAMPVMHAMLSTGQATDLSDAYERAVGTVPAYQQELASKAAEDAKTKEAEKRAKAADKAKRAAKSVEGRSSKPPPQKQATTLRDELLAAWDKSSRGEL